MPLCHVPLCHVTNGPPGARLRGEPFLHCCTEAQLGFVLQRHFAGRSGLWVVRFDPAAIEGRIEWVRSEPDQDAFPHLYGEIVVALARVTESQ